MKGNVNCPCCGALATESILWYLKSLEREMQKIYGIEYQLTINSCKRCIIHNKEVGGSPSSEHLESKAADIAVKNANERYWLIHSMIKILDLKRILVYENFIHMGISKDHPTPIISYMK